MTSCTDSLFSLSCLYYLFPTVIVSEICDLVKGFLGLKRKPKSSDEKYNFFSIIPFPLILDPSTSVSFTTGVSAMSIAYKMSSSLLLPPIVSFVLPLDLFDVGLVLLFMTCFLACLLVG